MCSFSTAHVVKTAIKIKKYLVVLLSYVLPLLKSQVNKLNLPNKNLAFQRVTWDSPCLTSFLELGHGHYQDCI